MLEKIKQIAVRIKELREIEGISPEAIDIMVRVNPRRLLDV